MESGSAHTIPNVPQLPAHFLDETERDGEAEPRSISNLLGRKERLEHTALYLLTNPCPVIRDRNTNIVSAFICSNKM